MNPGRNLIWQLPLLFLLSLPLWRGEAGRWLNPRDPGAFGAGDSRPRESLTMAGVTFQQSQAGGGEWRLTAEEVSGREELRSFTFVEPRLRFSGREEGEDLVSARQAVFDTALQTIAFSGQVLLVTGEGYRLQAEALQYLIGEKQLRSESEITFTASGLRIRGGSVQYELANGNFTAGGRVACELW